MYLIDVTKLPSISWMFSGSLKVGIGLFIGSGYNR